MMKLAKKTKFRGDKSMRPFRMFLLSFFAVLAFAFGAAAQQDQINTVVGGGPNDMPALDADLNNPYQVTVDSSGNYYFAVPAQNRVFKVTSAGSLTVVAGNGIAGYSGDGVTGGASQAMLNSPQGVALDGLGNIYIADSSNFVIRKVDTTNTITTVAGVQGSCQYDGDGSPATSFSLCYPNQLTVDSSNNLLIADSYNGLIRKLSGTTISTVAGKVPQTGPYGYCPNGTLASNCSFNYASAVAIDAAGDIFLMDWSQYVIYEISHTTNKVTTIAGTAGTGGFSGDGGAATSAEIDPYEWGQIAVNSAGTLVWLADTYNFRIRQINVGGHINTVAGDGGGGFSGDAGPATSATLYYPEGIGVDSADDLFIGDTANDRIREVVCDVTSVTCTVPAGETAQDIYTLAGNGSTTNATPYNNVPALGVTLLYPDGVYQDSSNNIFISDAGNYLVRELLNSNGDVDFFAGTGTAGYTGDGGPATSAEINSAGILSLDSTGNVYFADYYNQIIREVDTAGNISTFAGTPQSPGYSGDGGPATSAQLYYPDDAYLDNYGNMFIADSYNHVIREIVCAVTPAPPYACTPPAGKTAGFIYTVAGSNVAGYGGDGGPATSAKLYYPYSASTDAAGNLYIADTYNHRIREVNASTGIINTIAGNGTAGFTGDGPALENSLYYPNEVRADANGNVFIVDTDNERIRWVDGGGTLTTFAGTNTAGFTGDGGPATSAEFYYPYALFEDAAGDFLIADGYNSRVRKIDAFAAIGRSTGSIVFGEQPKGIQSYPFAVTLSGIGPAVIDSITTSGDFSELDDCVGSLPNGTNCSVSVFFTPTASGARYGTLTVNTNGYFSTTTTISLQGTGTGLTITPSPLAMGSTVVNSPVTKSITVKGGTTYTSVTLEGDTTDFKIATNTCTGVVASTCAVGITFDPTTTGAKTATLVLKDTDPTSPQVVSITGTGTSLESLTPTSVTFASQLSNAVSKNTKITFKYTGTGTLSLTGLTASTSFTTNITGLTSACVAGTTTLTHNQVCYFNVAFAPNYALGTITGNVTLTFGGDPNNSSSVLPLTGTSTEVSFTPPTLGFGTVATNKTLSVTVKNVGTTPLAFSGTPTITGTGSSNFVLQPYSGSTSTCLNPSLTTLAQNATCTFTVKFTNAGGTTAFTTYLNVSDNGGASPQLVKMTATD
jgi:hypothetical protein